MIKSSTLIRVRYAETDQMGYVYYGNYAKYYEVGRVELFRASGVSYKDLEDKGIMMPVIKLEIKYVTPAKYDDELKIVTMIKEVPKGPRIKFDYEVYNQNEQLINTGICELVFVDMAKNRPCPAPEYLIESLKKHYNID